jgi:PAS domain S-box-containing protein
VLANAAAAELLGLAEADLPGTQLLPLLFAEPEQGAADEVLDRVFGGEPWQGELLVRHRDGGPRAASISVSPLPDEDRTAGALLVVEDAGGSRRRAQRLTERLTRLARVTAELLRADDVTTVTTIVTRHMADAAGATVASLSVLVAEDRLRPARHPRWQGWGGRPLGDLPGGRHPGRRLRHRPTPAGPHRPRRDPVPLPRPGERGRGRAVGGVPAVAGR